MNTFSVVTSSLKTTLSNGKRQPGQNLPDPLPVKSSKVSTMPLGEKVYRGLTSPVRLLPDFLVIGAQRGGTTSLYQYLQVHPFIEPATTKEVHFFDRRFHKGLAWYRGHFPTALEKYRAEHLRGGMFLTGEATPSYLFLPYIPKRVVRVLPHARFIVLLRNPVERAYSHYRHAVELGHEHLAFEEAIKNQAARIDHE